MRTILILILSLLMAAPSHAAKNTDNAKAVLDRTAKQIKASTPFEVEFTASTFSGTQEQGSLQGTLRMKGKKFSIASSNMACWYDGQTLWSLNKSSEEVNVSTPSDKEKQSMNPYMFVDLYKNGYSASMKQVQLRNKDCHEVTLHASNAKKEVQEMIITIDKQTMLPLCVRMRQGSNRWIRISIFQYKSHMKFSDDMFTFYHKDFPQATVIDIR